MTRKLLLFLLTLLPATSFAQQFTLIVVKENAQPADGATVKLIQANKQASMIVTNARGQARFQNIAQGVFSFTLASAFFLIKSSLILLAIPAARFAYAVYETRQEWKQRSMPQPDEDRREIAPPLPAISLEPGTHRRVADTAEVEQPPSVTENTTELLAGPEG